MILMPMTNDPERVQASDNFVAVDPQTVKLVRGLGKENGQHMTEIVLYIGEIVRYSVGISVAEVYCYLTEQLQAKF